MCPDCGGGDFRNCWGEGPENCQCLTCGKTFVFSYSPAVLKELENSPRYGLYLSPLKAQQSQTNDCFDFSVPAEFSHTSPTGRRVSFGPVVREYRACVREEFQRGWTMWSWMICEPAPSWFPLTDDRIIFRGWETTEEKAQLEVVLQMSRLLTADARLESYAAE